MAMVVKDDSSLQGGLTAQVRCLVRGSAAI